ncbi:MAG: Nucleoside 2-deoxyribosyltransferase [Methanocella sp. PtaU1.Bin125]|nr:MAG: Nucleoside 2-deoxyribosyltransferase [Methanocella sp. PtaU1.Bin125]
MKLFLSGPFFTAEEVARLDRVKSALEKAGFEVYSTYHRNSRIDLGSARAKKQRFTMLCKEIEESDGLFAVLDGRDPGTIWEIGYAFAAGKQVVAFWEKDPYFSLMIDGSAACLIGFDSIGRHIGDCLAGGMVNRPTGISPGGKEDY